MRRHTHTSPLFHKLTQNERLALRVARLKDDLEAEKLRNNAISSECHALTNEVETLAATLKAVYLDRANISRNARVIRVMLVLSLVTSFALVIWKFLR